MRETATCFHFSFKMMHALVTTTLTPRRKRMCDIMYIPNNRIGGMALGMLLANAAAVVAEVMPMVNPERDSVHRRRSSSVSLKRSLDGTSFSLCVQWS